MTASTAMPPRPVLERLLATALLLSIAFATGSTLADGPGEADALRRACDANELEACVDLARAYEYGEGGVEADEERSLALLDRACDGGLADACTSLATRLNPGILSMLNPPPRTIELYERACELGSVAGCWNAGQIHEAGRNVEVDTARALALYGRGCAMGNRYACQDVGRLEDVLRGPPSRRGAAARPTTVLDVTLGSTTIDQLEALHPVDRSFELACAGGPAYDLLEPSLGEENLLMALFLFDGDGVLAGVTTTMDIDRERETRSRFDETFIAVPRAEAVALGADPLWRHGDAEIILYEPPLGNDFMVGYYDWGVRGPCIKMQPN